MTLEDLISSENGVTFWKEFVFSNLKFKVPAGEVELADNLVWFGDFAIVMQMKERETPTEDPEKERKWFKQKVLRDAKDQIKDSLGYLRQQGAIEVGNARGHSIEVRHDELRDIKSVILYKAGPALPPDSRSVQFYESANAGFIHIFAETDYRRVLTTLVAPEEVRCYLSYREASLRKLKASGTRVAEGDVLGAYAFDEALPAPSSHRRLTNLVAQDEPKAFSWVMGNLADRIENPTGDASYSKIMVEFAKLPRSIWRAAKERLDLAIKHAKDDGFDRPYHFYFPETQCAFMITAIHPEAKAAGGAHRSAYLGTLTAAAKYLHKAPRAVGIQVSSAGNGDIMIDWCLMDDPWVQTTEMDKWLEESPFRPAREKKIDGFLFKS
jgi:hypothetical protein